MKSSIYKFKGEEFIKLDLIPVTQKDQTFFIAKLMADILVNAYTVRPAEYDVKKNTELAKEFLDEKEYYQHLIEKNVEKIGNKDFQRHYDKGRVNKIAKFINEDEYPLFPNTIIATCELINTYEQLNINENSSFEEFVKNRGNLKHLSFLEKNIQNDYKLYIPYSEKSILVIDGQHRLEGLKSADFQIIRTYEVLLSFLLGFDRSIIAKQFYTINYEQKSVNKSLLYQLTGEFSTEINELTFLHNVVKILNELEDSPFNGRIKMLGVTPKDTPIDERQRLSLSQAFLIDWLIKTISSGSKKSIYQPIFLSYFKKKEKHAHIILFLKKYFQAIKELKPDWETPNKSVISKGIGVGALIRLLHFLYIKILKDEFNDDKSFIETIEVNYLKAKLKGIESVDFTETGLYKGKGSAGSINDIVKDLVLSIEYFGATDYNSFIENFKNNYINSFNT